MLNVSRVCFGSAFALVLRPVLYHKYIQCKNEQLSMIIIQISSDDIVAGYPCLIQCYVLIVIPFEEREKHTVT